MPPESGRTAVVVPVPAAEGVVAPWRARFDDSAAQGMPAHITVVYPFLPEHRLSDGVLADLGELCGGLPVLDVEFRRAARFPGVVFLDPDPADGLRRLTLALAERWPEAPPYGGAFDDVVPHLTVAQVPDRGVLDAVDAAVSRQLPVRARLPEACLYVFDGARWRPRLRLPFGSGRGVRPPRRGPPRRPA